MYLAKPNMFNSLHAREFETIKEATHYLNDRLKVEVKYDALGNLIDPAMIFPKMGWEDFAILGKILKIVDGSKTEPLEVS